MYKRWCGSRHSVESEPWCKKNVLNHMIAKYADCGCITSGIVSGTSDFAIKSMSSGALAITTAPSLAES